ncbi:DUF6476 family protein [Crenalkalicoccus roseus]|uniref:DUF6476 family protein n=1 Tax=Crenalkalicoccus roseus TaxID=1485588 RepID=UPI0010817A97|nr:DUF6476 family protein [Crenalkalicoccus roseus]
MRALKVLVVVMGVLIVFGTVALAIAIVQRLGEAGREITRADLSLALPEGARIGGIAAAADGTLAVWVTGPGEDRILLVDPRRGRVAGEIRAGR